MPTLDQTLWVERHRPETLDDIVGHDPVVKRMKDFVDDPAMPNLLFAGKQGIGKTAVIQGFAKEKYGENWRNSILELNASDARGIDIVRDEIKSFARQGTTDLADFKIIFLDEADQLTRDAQPALRRIMEDYDDRTRFILSCNYPNQIIDPIQSRCAIFRMSALTDSQIKQVLENVVDVENVDADEDALLHIIAEARGDARKAINTLQACVVDNQITELETREIIGEVDDELIQGIVEDSISGNLDDAIKRLDVEVLKRGINPNRVVESAERAIQNSNLPPDAEMKAYDVIGDADWRIRRGANPHIQLHRMLAALLIARHAGMEPYE